MDQLNNKNYFVTGSEKATILPLTTITHCESKGAYTIIYTVDDKDYMISKNLKTVQQDFRSACFLRISKSLLINIYYLRHIYGKKKQIELTTGKLLCFTLSLHSLNIAIRPLFYNNDEPHS